MIQSKKVTFVEGGLGAITVGHQQGTVCVELHRGVMVGVCRRAPVLHESNPVFIGVGERPITTRAVVADIDINLEPFQDGVLLAEGLTIDDSLAFASPVVAVCIVTVASFQSKV